METKKMTLYFVVPIDLVEVKNYIRGNYFVDFSPEHLRDTIEDQFNCPNTLTFYQSALGFCDALNDDEINLFDNFVVNAELEIKKL